MSFASNLRNVKLPGTGPSASIVRAVVAGGVLIYGATNSLYNVEGGHRAIIFNRLVGVKDKVTQIRAENNSHRHALRSIRLTLQHFNSRRKSSSAQFLFKLDNSRSA